MPDPTATNLASLLAQARRDRCPACRGPIAAVPRASDRAELTCLEPACNWAARIEGGRVIPLAAEAVDQDDELYPDRPGDGGPACDTRSHRRRPPCRLCRKVSHEGGLCERHWIEYRHATRLMNPRPHPLDWAADRKWVAPIGIPATVPETVRLPTSYPCPCGCGRMFSIAWTKGNLCKAARDRYRWYLKGGGKLGRSAWLAAGQPTAKRPRRPTKKPRPSPQPVENRRRPNLSRAGA